ncbi:fungal-specific transcription factor domain-containing protein [Fusarium oxysporum]|nr:fungal-specific transcription factor domain-containing protein [Fusarium oxysporum]
MESSPESVRPVKRVKYARQDDAIPLNIATSSIRDSDSADASLVTDVPLFENTWPMTTGVSSPSEVLFNLPEDLGNSWAPAFTGDEREHVAPTHPALTPTLTPLHNPTENPSFIHHVPDFVPIPAEKIKTTRRPDHAMVDYQVRELTFHSAPQPALNLQVATAPQPEPQPEPPRSQAQRLPRLLPAVHDALPERAVEPQDSKKRGLAPVEGLVVSPFTANEDRLIVSAYPRYARPENGQVNGYVKFNWPSRAPSRRPSGPVPLPPEDDVEDITSNVTRSHTAGRTPTIITLVNPGPAVSSAPNGTISPMDLEGGWGSTSSPILMAGSPVSVQDTSQILVAGDPKMLPPQFGFQAKMDHIDRRLFEFYIKNWCPGRSVLSNTNLWLKDLAPMHKNEGILHAIQSLAGVYIYDYIPDERIRQRINQRYVTADQYFSTLLNAPESRENGKGQEVITMAVLLSMQDIVLTERRLKKPYNPRWLEGFRQGEYFLQATDPGARYWKNNNVQYNELRISQSIIVGRAVILAQPMMALPSPETFNPEAEAGRFSWLLYGTEKDMFEIHGGCGFSKKLLHLMSQVTYCAGRLQQEPESTIVPITAKFLLRELSEMRQWSREGKDWELARKYPPTIDWVRDKADEVIIDSNQIMTEVTAEAWRIAAIIYYQCRLLRLPRNHPEVLANLDDLARCIRIMPTSGSHFTAQAPLLPVFFLGLLATEPVHKDVSMDWFEQVVQTPVRSSVPPLYDALLRIWGWIDKEVQIPRDPTALPKAIGKRYPWWEHLVAKVLEAEEETLCLT